MPKVQQTITNPKPPNQKDEVGVGERDVRHGGGLVMQYDTLGSWSFIGCGCSSSCFGGGAAPPPAILLLPCLVPRNRPLHLTDSLRSAATPRLHSKAEQGTGPSRGRRRRSRRGHAGEEEDGWFFACEGGQGAGAQRRKQQPLKKRRGQGTACCWLLLVVVLVPRSKESAVRRAKEEELRPPCRHGGFRALFPLPPPSLSASHGIRVGAFPHRCHADRGGKCAPRSPRRKSFAPERRRQRGGEDCGDCSVCEEMVVQVREKTGRELFSWCAGAAKLFRFGWAGALCFLRGWMEVRDGGRRLACVCGLVPWLVLLSAERGWTRACDAPWVGIGQAGKTGRATVRGRADCRSAAGVYHCLPPPATCRRKSEPLPELPPSPWD
jgi:hypothetical protein